MIKAGCIRDEHDPRDYAFLPEVGALFGSEDVDLTRYCPEIWDQIANDCVAHALSAATMCLANVALKPAQKPSVLYNYANSRQLARGELRDVGTNCRSMLKAMSGRTIQNADGTLTGLGMVREEDWPESPEIVNTLPPDDLLRQGANWTISSYARIPENGPVTVPALLTALAARKFPTVCFVVDETFTKLGGNVYMGNDSRLIGGHCMLVVGYSSVANAFLIRNSWGEGWGTNGYGFVSKDFVINHAYDMWVIEA